MHVALFCRPPSETLPVRAAAPRHRHRDWCVPFPDLHLMVGSGYGSTTDVAVWRGLLPISSSNNGSVDASEVRRLGNYTAGEYNLLFAPAHVTVGENLWVVADQDGGVRITGVR